MRSYRTVLKGVVMLLIIRPAIQAGEDLSNPYEILKRHYDALGGLDKLKAEKTRYSEGSIVIEGTGLQGTVKIWAEVPSKERQEVDLTIIRQTSGDNGLFSWEVDPNGKLQIRKDEATQKRRKMRALLATYDHVNPKSENFSLSFEGVEKVNDTDCYVVKTVNTMNDDVIMEYFDTNTFYLKKSVTIEPDVERRTLFSDFREVQGLIRPFQQKTEILPLGQKITLQLNRYEGNIDIDPSLFEPPGQDVKDYRFVHGKSAENVPFRYLADHIFIPVNIHGRERLWILDSGASMSVIDSVYVSELGLQAEGDMKGVGAGRTLQVSFVDLPPFSIPGIKFEGQKAASASFLRPYAHKHFGMEVVGILGYDFLSRFVTKVDYAKEKLAFYDPETFQYDGDGVVLEAPLVENTFSLPVTVDGKLTGMWSLDLGAGNVSFHYPFAEENGLLSMKGIDRMGFGAGGEFGSRTVEFETVEWAGFTLRKPLIQMLLQMGEGAFRRRELVGNLGNSLFRHFVLYLDYKRQSVIVEKGAHFDKEFPRDKSGMQIVLSEGDRIETVFVAPGTPAEKAGLKKGDIITSINAINTEHFGGLLAVRDLLKKETGTEYELTVLRAGEIEDITLTLQDLY